MSGSGGKKGIAMNLARMAPASLALAAVLSGGQAFAQAAPLIMVYGPAAPSREGDVNHMERMFISVPAGLADRLYLRVFDPETVGANDTPFGRATDSVTRFALFGGLGAYSGAPRPKPAADGAPAAAPDPDQAAFSGGALIVEQEFGAHAATDDAWVTLATFTAAEGEAIDGRAWFRLDVTGAAGDDGNAFTIEASLSPTRSDPPEGVRIIAFEPTIRWPNRGEPTELRFGATEGAQVALHNFDAAGAALTLASTFGEAPLAASDQDVWAVAPFTVPEGRTAITLRGGRETPNDVTLALFDADGRALPFEMPPRPAPREARPTPAPVARPLADCTSVAFDATGSRGAGPLGYRWSFGDGGQTDEAVFAHRYAAPGTYEATLRVVEPGERVANGAMASVSVLVRPAPIAKGGGAVIAAPGEPVAFDGSASVPSDLPIRRYLWSFGDGARAEGATAQRVYERPGVYNAILRVEDDARHPCNFGLATRVVTVNFPPVAEAGEARSAATGQAVTLQGGASYDVDGAIGDYRWDLGDGAVAQGASVTHVYTAPGTYVATLRVRDESGVANAEASDTVTITVNAPPQPVMAGPDRPIAVGEVARLDGSASSDPDGDILSYFWEFGDGAAGDGAVVDYAWAQPGVYTVRLTVTDNSATSSAVSSGAFDVVVSAAPVADAGPDQHVTASVVAFDGGGSSDADGRITSWDWTFGDGAAGAGRVVRHAYARPGDYEVSLTVRDDSGAPLNVARDTMRVRVNATPIADAGPDMTGAPGQEMILDASGSVDPDGAIESFEWRFSDGTEAQGRRVAKRFITPGLHRASLTVRDDTGQDAAFDVDEALVTINAPPVAVAGPDILTEPGAPVRLSAANSYDPDGRIIAYRWDFDDLADPVFTAVADRAFADPGVRNAQLTVIDASGAANASATDDVRIRVNHAPVAEAGPEVRSDGLFISLDGSDSVDADGDQLIYSWDFGDGSPPALGRVVTHVYPRGGVFPVTLKVDDGTGLGNATSLDATRVIIDVPPVAVAGSNRDVCSGDTILFDGSASADPDGGLLRYSWDFGDGTRLDIVNPSKSYERPGVYPVSLTVRDESGSPRGVHTDRIAVVVREAPIADAGLPINACTNQNVRFDGSGSTDADGAVNLFSWNFGDGSTGGGERPVHVYERPGSYRVVLTITGDARGACSALDTDETTVNVVEAPRVVIEGADRVAIGVDERYEAAILGPVAQEGATFAWRFSDGAVAEGAAVSHAFAEPGVHFATLSATLPGAGVGCEAVETRLKIVVNAPPTPAIAAPDHVAAGDMALFDGAASADSDGALTRFDWDFGDGTTASGVETRHRFVEAGTYAVRLTVADDAGVANSRVTATRQVIVNPPPVAGLVAPPPLCPGVAHDWSAPAGAGVAALWRFGDGTETAGARVSHAFAAPGVYPASVTLDDGAGLPNSRRAETVFARVNRPPTAEAGPDRLICPGDPVVFDAGASADLDGAITAYRWEFSDGVTLEGARVERSFAAAGAVEARLIVTDDSGAACAAGVDIANVTVNASPIVDAGPDREVDIGAAHDDVLFDASDATDPDGDGLVTTWDFGDGARATGAIVRHAFTRPGDYTVRVEARDATGLACAISTDSAIVRARARG